MDRQDWDVDHAYRWASVNELNELNSAGLVFYIHGVLNLDVRGPCALIEVTNFGDYDPAIGKVSYAIEVNGERYPIIEEDHWEYDEEAIPF